MMEMSEIGKKMLEYQWLLARAYQYQPIGISLFEGDVRAKYRSALPDWCREEGDDERPLRTLDGTLFATGYQRIVIGDYGAFVEIDPKQICKDVLKCKQGQEYRIHEERFAKHVKYFWLTTKDQSDCKIYYQKKAVAYADYKPGMFYVTPYEIMP